MIQIVSRGAVNLMKLYMECELVLAVLLYRKGYNVIMPIASYNFPPSIW